MQRVQQHRGERLTERRFYVVRLVETHGPEFLTARGQWVRTPGEADVFPVTTAMLLMRDHGARAPLAHAGPAQIIEQSFVEALVVLGSRHEAQGGSA